MKLIHSAVGACLLAVVYAFVPNNEARELDGVAPCPSGLGVKVYHPNVKNSQIKLCEATAYGAPVEISLTKPSTVTGPLCLCDIKLYADQAKTREIKVQDATGSTPSVGTAGNALGGTSACFCTDTNPKFWKAKIIGHEAIQVISLVGHSTNSLASIEVKVNNELKHTVPANQAVGNYQHVFTDPVIGRVKLPFDFSVLWSNGKDTTGLQAVSAPDVVDGNPASSSCGTTSSNMESPFWLGYHANTGSIRRLVLVDHNEGADKTDGVSVEINGVNVATNVQFPDADGANGVKKDVVIIDIDATKASQIGGSCPPLTGYPMNPFPTSAPVAIKCPDTEVKVTVQNPSAACEPIDPIAVGQVTATGKQSQIITDQIIVTSPQGPIADPGTYDITVSVTDEGETKSCTFQLEIDDAAPPLISCVSTKTVALESDCTLDLDALLADDSEGGMIIEYSDMCSAIPPTVDGLRGSKVRLEHPTIVQLCEFELFADDAMTIPITMQNANGPSSWVDNDHPTHPGLVIDGNRNQDWFGGDSCWHKASGDNTTPQWWTADIVDTAVPIKKIRITNRMDCCSERIFGMKVYIDDILVYTVPNEVRSEYIATMHTGNPGFKLHKLLSYPPTINGVGTYDIGLQVADEYGNEAHCEAKLTVQDTTGPVISGCPNADAVHLIDVGAACSVAIDPNTLAQEVGLTAYDSCTGVVSTWTAQSAVTLTSHDQEASVTLVATDKNGQASTCVVNVKGVDSTDPTISCSDISIPTQYLGSTCDASITTELNTARSFAKSTDNCGTTITWSGDASLKKGSNNFIFTATDAAGNSASCSITVTAADNTSPTMDVSQLPASHTFTAAEGCTASLNFAPQVSDNCDASPSVTPPGPHSIVLGVQTITFEAKDADDNVYEYTHTITGVDATNPTIVNCPAGELKTVDFVGKQGCKHMINLVNYFGLQLTDNCAPAPQWVDSEFEVERGVETEVTITAKDFSENEVSCTFRVKGVDKTPPTLTCSDSWNIDVDENECSTSILGNFGDAVSASDDCDTDVEITATETSFTELGTKTVTFTATDEDGNTATCDVDIIVEDEENPEIECPLHLTNEAVDENCEFTFPNEFIATGNDNCDASVEISGPLDADDNPITKVGLVDTHVYFKAVDDSGNQVTCSTKVITSDTKGPVFTNCPEGTTQTITVPNGACPGTVDVRTEFSITAADNCGGNVVWTGFSYEYGLEPVDVVLVATDQRGQSSECKFKIQGEDTTDPVISCPSGLQYHLSANVCDKDMSELIASKFNGQVSAEDGCDSSVTPQFVSGPSVLQEGANTYEFKAVDDSANEVTCTFIVTGVDSTSPDITCPPDQTVKANAQCVYPNDFVASASDNCGQPGFEVQSSNTDTWLPIGDTTITFTATDGSSASNDVSCEVTVTVEDQTPPSISNCPQETQTFELPAGLCTTSNVNVVDLYSMTATDNCDSPEQITWNDHLVTITAGQSTEVSLTATDSSGQTMTCEFTIVGKDVERPKMTCPESLVYPLDNDSCDTNVGAQVRSQVSATDNCQATITRTKGSDVIGIGVTEFVFTATDDNNNVQTCTIQVTGLDVTDPTVECMAQFETNADGNCQRVNDFTAQSVGDHCDSAVTAVNTGPAFLSLGFNKFDFVATDKSGNTNGCTQEIIVVDATKPTLQGCYPNGAENPLLIDLPSNACSIPGYNVAGQTITATDNCDNSVDMSGHVVDISLNPTTVVVTATDDFKNSESCSFTVRGRDVTPPQIACPEQVQVFEVGDQASCTLDIAQAVNSLFNGLVSVTESCPYSVTKPSTTIELGIQSLTYSVTDNVHNAQCSVQVAGTDSVAPQVTCPPATTVKLLADCTYKNDFMASAYDYCGAAPVVKFSDDAKLETFSGLRTYTLEYSATDPSNNVGGCSVDIQTEDVHGPTISNCPSAEEVLLVNLEKTGCAKQVDLVTTLGLTASDSCGGSITWPDRMQTVQGTDVVKFTVNAVDARGNPTPCEFSVQGVDIKKPEIFCPYEIQYISHGPSTCETTFPLENWMNDESLIWVEDDCDEYEIIKVEPEENTVDGFGVSSREQVTLKVVDGSGNEDYCSFWVQGKDVTAPKAVNCPQKNTLKLDDDTCRLAIDYKDPAIFTDSCGDVTVTQSIDSIGVGANTVTLTATDTAGNVNSACVFVLHGSDQTPPSITCPTDDIVNVDSACNKGIPDYRSQAIASDSCNQPGLVVTQTDNNGGNLIIDENVQVTLTATDQAGNSNSCSFNVKAVDGYAPTIKCPANKKVKVNGACKYTVLDFKSEVEASDSCDNALIVTQSPQPGTIVSSLSSTTVTMTATDASNQQTSCTFELEKVDEVKPVFDVCPTINDPLPAGEACQATIDLVSLAEASDSCGGTVAITQAGAMTYGLGVHSITLTAEDERGNTQTCTVPVTVSDQTPPTSLTCPSFKTLPLNAECTRQITGPMYAQYLSEASGTDNCAFSIDYVGEKPSSIGLEQKSVTVRVTDAGNNYKDCSFQIIGQDVTGPKMTCPPDQTFAIDTTGESCTNERDFSALGQYSDTCGQELKSVVQVSTTFGYGTKQVTVKAVDEANNENTCTFMVTGTDNTAPKFTSCPANGALTFDLDADCRRDLGELNYFRNQVAASDKCNVLPTITRTSGDVKAGLGLNTITYRATDAAALSAICQFTVIGKDVTKPTITCPSPTTVTLNDQCKYTHSFKATASDTCDGALVPFQSAGPTTFTQVGTSTLQFKAVDAANNFRTCSVNIEVVDKTGPVITGCPESDIKVTLPEDACTTEIDIMELVPDLKATDACAGAVTWSTATHTIGLGDNAINMVATDASGVTSTCPINVVGVDKNAPEILCPLDQYLSHGPESCTSQIPISDYIPLAEVTDNCDGSVVTKLSGATSVSKTRQQMELVVTDSSGNKDTCTFWVIPQDVTPPSIKCPADTSQVLTAACSYDVTNMYVASTEVSDACGTVTVTQDATTIGYGPNTITMTAEDETGLTSTCSFTVTGIDKTLPSMTCPDQEVSVDGACSKSVPQYNPSQVSDNCGGEVTVVQGGATELVIGGSVTATFTATDASNNVRTCEFQVSAKYDSSPTISCPSDMVLPVDSNCDFTVGDYTKQTSAKDACDNVLEVSQSPAPEDIVQGLGSTVITMSTVDEAGVSAECSFTITKTDTTGPVFECLEDQRVALDGETCSASFDYTAEASGTDACGGPVIFTHQVKEIDGVGSVTVELVGTDARGQKSTCSFSVEGYDDVPPIVTCPDDQALLLSSSCTANTLGAASKFDACGTATVAKSVATITGTDEVEVTLTATDEAGLSSTCSYKLTGDDNTAPTIACEGKSYDLDENCQLEVDFATAPTLKSFADTCAGTVTVEASISTIGLGANTVVLTATDASENEKTCTLVATGVDVTPPSISCPDDFEKDLDSGCSLAEVDFTEMVEASDSCGEVSISQDVSEIGLGSNTITMTATDGAGLQSQCSFTVTGVDVSPPKLVCPGSKALECGESIPDLTSEVTVSDTCENSGSLVTLQQEVEEKDVDAFYLVHITASDGKNTVTCTVEVTVAPCAVPCVPLEWGEWSECSKICGTGTKTRTRGIDAQGVYGGTLCGDGDGEIPLTEEATCNEQECSCTSRVVAGLDYTYQNNGRHGRQLEFAIAQLVAATQYLQYTIHPDLMHMGIQAILPGESQSLVDLDSALAQDPALLDFMYVVGTTARGVNSKYSDFAEFFENAVEQLNANTVEGQERFILWMTDGVPETTNRKKLKAIYESLDKALESPNPIKIICYRPSTWIKFDKLTDRYCTVRWTQQEGEIEEKNRYTIGYEMANVICPTRVNEEGSETEVSADIENPCPPIRAKKACEQRRAQSDGSEPTAEHKGFLFCSWNRKSRTCDVKPKYAPLFEDTSDAQDDPNATEPSANDPCHFLTKKSKCVKKKVNVNGQKKVRVCAWDGEFCNLKAEYASSF